MSEDGRAEPSVLPAIRLRVMTNEDVAECVPLLSQLGYELSLEEVARRVEAVLSNPDHCLAVAESRGRVVGLLHVFDRPAIENPREAVVQAIVVDQACRQTGIGRVLMASAEHWGRERNCRSVVLSSNVVRAPAHVFYRALGYRVSATSRIFRKLLQPPLPTQRRSRSAERTGLRS